jgi:hypothetical protein
LIFKGNKMRLATKSLITIIATSFLLSGCMPANQKPTYLTPAELASFAPEPIEDNSGLFMSPYTSDEVLAEWVDKSINAKMGAALGSTAGSLAGQKLLEDIPFVGGLLGKEVGEKLGREMAIKAAGGEEFIKETSDLSFNTLQDLAVFLYANYSDNKHFNDALDATKAIYPELARNYHIYIQTASAQVQ